MIYVIDKDLSIVKITGYDLQMVKSRITELGLTNYVILKELADMNYVSRIYKVDDTIIYNNKVFWQTTASEIANDFENHTVIDFMENQVTKEQFMNEYYTNATRIEKTKDGIASQIQYNRIVGGEFIDLFREECTTLTLSKFGTSEAALLSKLSNVIPMLITGTFRTAIYFLTNITKDEFLTNERVNKYIQMLSAADAIDYDH
jgi:hypothetical protein